MTETERQRERDRVREMGQVRRVMRRTGSEHYPGSLPQEKDSLDFCPRPLL
jgi:hypothetical protein